MAVPGRRNGMIEYDDDIEENGLFEEEDLVELDDETPPHLRDLAAATELGDLEALRLALESSNSSTDTSSPYKSKVEDEVLGSGPTDNLTGSIDEPVEDGDSALHIACLYGHLPCVQLLLERGASLEAKDEDGAIPLHDACAGGYIEIAQLLLNFSNDSEIVKRMLESVDVEGDTPLHHAARGEHVDVIRLLLASGASPTNTNSYAKTPSELADQNTEARRILEAAAAAAAAASE